MRHSRQPWQRVWLPWRLEAPSCARVQSARTKKSTDMPVTSWKNRYPFHLLLNFCRIIVQSYLCIWECSIYSVQWHDVFGELESIQPSFTKLLQNIGKQRSLYLQFFCDFCISLLKIPNNFDCCVLETAGNTELGVNSNPQFVEGRRTCKNVFFVYFWTYLIWTAYWF